MRLKHAPQARSSVTTNDLQDSAPELSHHTVQYRTVQAHPPMFLLLRSIALVPAWAEAWERFAGVTVMKGKTTLCAGASGAADSLEAAADSLEALMRVASVPPAPLHSPGSTFLVGRAAILSLCS